jgi:outer membrane murein-binding lipoprotein Lpp
MNQVVVHFPNFHFDYYCIVPHTTESQVLLLKGENGWFLPHFVPYEHHFGMVGHINQAMKTQLGLDVTTLRCFYEHYSLRTNTGFRVYAMENYSPGRTLLANMRWIEFQELEYLKFANNELQQVLQTWFTDINNSEIPVQRVPWAKSGWFSSAVTWINSQLALLGLSSSAPIEQIKSQSRSCLLKVYTTTETIYFKAVHSVFSGEPVFTQILARFYPDYSPELLAVDPKQQWMLIRDFGGKLLSQTTNFATWEASLYLFAQMQVQAVNKANELLEAGFANRKIDQLVSQIEPLLTNISALQLSQNVSLTDAEIEDLKALTPKIKAMCHELSTGGIPQTLVHGDLHSQNIIVTDDRYIFFDWSDAAIAHPFFDAVFFLQQIEKEIPEITNGRELLRKAYLEAWTIYLPMEQLIELFEKAYPVTALYHAIVSYEITQNLETSHRWETEESVPYFLKSLLQHLAP